jgi:hypothetical protein
VKSGKVKKISDGKEKISLVFVGLSYQGKDTVFRFPV